VNLEQELRALPLVFPPEPDFEARVLARLERRRRRWLVPALAVVAAVGALLAIPQTRAAILDFLRIGDVSVERVGTQPRAPAREPELGRPVSFRDAQASVDFPLLAPERNFESYLDESVRGGMVNLRFGGLVLSQWRGAQLPFVEKQVGPGSETVGVVVDGARGLWIGGAEHVIAYGDGDEVHFKERRLAGNVLIWERDEITYRLEGPARRAQALAVARDLRRR
jgi:hypothetical protein